PTSRDCAQYRRNRACLRVRRLVDRELEGNARPYVDGGQPAISRRLPAREGFERTIWACASGLPYHSAVFANLASLFVGLLAGVHHLVQVLVLRLQKPSIRFAIVSDQRRRWRLVVDAYRREMALRDVGGRRRRWSFGGCCRRAAANTTR